MKKILAAALALSFALMAVSGLALVDPGNTGTNNFIFEDFRVSTQYAVTNSAGPASILAGDGKALSAGQMIYLDIVLGYDSKRATQVPSMRFDITSEDVKFSTFLNGTKATVHYLNAYNQVLPIMSVATQTNNPDYVPWAEPEVETDAKENTVSVTVDTGAWGNILKGDQYDARLLMPNLPGIEVSTTANWNPYTTFHIGLAGLVKDGGDKEEGSVNAALMLSSGGFDNYGPLLKVQDTAIREGLIQPANQVNYPSNESDIGKELIFGGGTVYTEPARGGRQGDNEEVTVTDPATPTQAYIYDDGGKAVYRIYKIQWLRSEDWKPNAAAQNGQSMAINPLYQIQVDANRSWTDFNGATEYIIHPITDTVRSTHYYASWAVGLRNIGWDHNTGEARNSRFGTLTFYQNITPFTLAPGGEEGLDLGIQSAAPVSNGYVRWTDGAPLNSYYQPILDFFGLSLKYSTAADDSMFTAKAGSGLSKAATFPRAE